VKRLVRPLVAAFISDVPPRPTRLTPFKPLPSFGSYFQLYDYSSFSNENENELAIRLTQEAGVATIPVSAFYKTPVDNKVLRFCFAKKEDTLNAAIERLQKL
jgi:methionine aminotransferase